MHTHYRGLSLPDAGDAIDLDTIFDTAIVATVASSVAAAKTRIANAIAEGKTISPTNPMLFLIAGNAYLADGTHLRCLNEAEAIETTIAVKDWFNVGKGAFVDVAISTLPARPYDRRVRVEGTINIDVGKGDNPVKGNVYWTARIGTDLTYWRLDEGQAEGAMVANSAIIKAGVAPNIRLQLHGGSEAGGGACKITNVGRMFITADPITMTL